METNNLAVRRRNAFLFLAGVLGLAFVALVLAPRLVQPIRVRTETTLRMAVQITGTPGAPPLAPTPTPTETAGTATPQAPATRGCRRYTVQSGDTLSTLASRFGVAEARIALANNLHSDILTPGQVLIICTAVSESSVQVPPAPPAVVSPPSIGRVEVLMTLIYPTKIYTRQPQWITLAVELPQETGPGVQFLPDVERVTRQSPVVLEPPPTPVPEMGMLTGGERWLAPRLTGVHITPRFGSDQQEQAITTLLNTRESLVWRWLFVPPEAGDYLFGLDVYASDEYRVVDEEGQVKMQRTDRRMVWAQDFRISVDEIFGIPRQWWILVSGLGAIINLLLAFLQIVGG